MIRKIWTSFRYGNRKTKSLILSIAFLTALSLSCIIMAIMTKSILWGLGAVFSSILAIVIANSVSFKSNNRNIPLKDKYTMTKRKYPHKEHDLKETPQKTPSLDKEEDSEDEEYEKKDYIKYLKQSDLKRIMVANKVKKDHKPVMIDISETYHIRQCPAFIWTDRRNFYMLLLEKQPRRIKIPLIALKTIIFKQGVTARRLLEYQEFQRPSFASLTFGNLLPTYFEINDRGKVQYKKNLYILEPDIAFTNTSIKAVMDMLKLDITIKNRIMNADTHSVYFKEGYKINLLWKDGVYNTQEYKEKIKNMLQRMAESNISLKVFKDAISELITGRLVTKEYAEYYIDYRNKLERKKP